MGWWNRRRRPPGAAVTVPGAVETAPRPLLPRGEWAQLAPLAPTSAIVPPLIGASLFTVPDLAATRPLVRLADEAMAVPFAADPPTPPPTPPPRPPRDDDSPAPGPGPAGDPEALTEAIVLLDAAISGAPMRHLAARAPSLVPRPVLDRVSADQVPIVFAEWPAGAPAADPSVEAASLETASLETASLETASLETASLETASLETASAEDQVFDPIAAWLVAEGRTPAPAGPEPERAWRYTLAQSRRMGLGAALGRPGEAVGPEGVAPEGDPAESSASGGESVAVGPELDSGPLQRVTGEPALLPPSSSGQDPVAGQRSTGSDSVADDLAAPLEVSRPARSSSAPPRSGSVHRQHPQPLEPARAPGAAPEETPEPPSSGLPSLAPWTLTRAPLGAAARESAPRESALLESAPLEPAPLESAPLEPAPLELAAGDPAPLELAAGEQAPPLPVAQFPHRFARFAIPDAVGAAPAPSRPIVPIARPVPPPATPASADPAVVEPSAAAPQQQLREPKTPARSARPAPAPAAPLSYRARLDPDPLAAPVAVPPTAVNSFARMTGIDLGFVPLHRGPEVTVTARESGARAFTRGGAVHLPGDHDLPGTTELEAVLAHELTHVAQQRALGAAATETGYLGAALEAQAVAVERAVGGGVAAPFPMADAVDPPGGFVDIEPGALSWTPAGGFLPSDHAPAALTPQRAPTVAVAPVETRQSRDELPAEVPSDPTSEGTSAEPRDEDAAASAEQDAPEPAGVAQAGAIAAVLAELTRRMDELTDKVGTPAGGGAGAKPDLDALAASMCDRVSTRLRADLVVERERSGLLYEFR